MGYTGKGLIMSDGLLFFLAVVATTLIYVIFLDKD